MQSGGGPGGGGSGPRTINLSRLTFQDLSRLLSTDSGSSRNTQFNGDDEDEESDDENDEDNYQHTACQWFPEVTEPQKAGVELLTSGDFGRVADKMRSRRKDFNIAKLVHRRPTWPRHVECKEEYATVCPVRT